MRMRRGAPLLALVACVATLAGCGGGDSADPTTPAPPPLTNAEQQALADFGIATFAWCLDGTPDPHPLTARVLAIHAENPAALLDDGTGLTVAEAVDRAADDVRPCDPALAAQLDAAAPAS